MELIGPKAFSVQTHFQPYKINIKVKNQIFDSESENTNEISHWKVSKRNKNMETTDIIGVVLGEFHLNINILPPQSGQADSEGPSRSRGLTSWESLWSNLGPLWTHVQTIIYLSHLNKLWCPIISQRNIWFSGTKLELKVKFAKIQADFSEV